MAGQKRYTAPLNFRVSETTRAELQRIAQARSMTITDVCRAMIDHGIPLANAKLREREAGHDRGHYRGRLL